MGSRKRIKAESMKEARKNIAFAKLNNCPTSFCFSKLGV